MTSHCLSREENVARFYRAVDRLGAQKIFIDLALDEIEFNLFGIHEPRVFMEDDGWNDPSFERVKFRPGVLVMFTILEGVEYEYVCI